jgi:hypothetical protein
MVSRSLGIVVIVLSSALPIMVTASYAGQQAVLWMASVAIAVITALRTFSPWEHRRLRFQQAEHSLTHLLARWEVVSAQLKLKDNDMSVSKATDELRQILRRSKRILKSSLT